jgi:hypothetical protein
VCYHRTMRRAVSGWLVLAAALAAAGSASAAADPLTTARRLYNQGLFDRALDAAREAEANAATVASARLVIGRVHLERFRRDADPADLDSARTALRTLDSHALDPRERLELVIGLAELLYFDDRFGAAAEMLEPTLDATLTLGPDAHERALEWWASALDRQAQAAPVDDRADVYQRIADRMQRELARDVASIPANYWLVAAARGAGDLPRAMEAATAAWLRSPLMKDGGIGLRADLDRLVLEGILPDRAARLPARDRRQALTGMQSEWESFKAKWR